MSHSWVLTALILCSLNSGSAVLHNVIRCSQERPQGLFNPPSTYYRLSVGSWLAAAKNTPVSLFVTYPCLPVITNSQNRKVWGCFLTLESKSNSFRWLYDPLVKSDHPYGVVTATPVASIVYSESKNPDWHECHNIIVMRLISVTLWWQINTANNRCGD